MIDKHSVMAYTALASAFFLLAAGFLRDVGMVNTSFSCLAISIISLIALLVTYLGPYFFISPDHDVKPGASRRS